MPDFTSSVFTVLSLDAIGEDSLSGDDLEGEVVDHEREVAIAKAIATLTPIQQEIVMKKFFEDKSIEQIAEEVDRTRDNVYKQLNKALASLKLIDGLRDLLRS